MTNHQAMLRLAATSIDFELAAGERAQLEAHVASCPDCRRQEQQLRQHASDLRYRPRATPSDRLRQLVETNIAAPRGRRGSFNAGSFALAAAATLIVVVGLGLSFPSLVSRLGIGASAAPTASASEVAEIQAYLGLAGSDVARADAGGHCHVVLESDCASDVLVAIGSVWLTTNDSILRFDPISATIVARIHVGAFPHRIWFGAGAIWTSTQRPGTLVRIDPDTNTVVVNIPIGGSPVGIVDGAGSIWVTDQAGDRVVQVDPATNTRLSAIPVSIHPRGIDFADGVVWVADDRADVLLRIDPITSRVAATVDVSAGAKGDSGLPADLVVALGRIWLTGHDAIVVYDPASGRVDHFTTQTLPRVAVARDAVWVAGTFNALIQRFDPTSLNLVGQSILYVNDTANKTSFEASIDVAPDGALWVATDDGNRLMRLTPTP
jgi:streptogramin lyase